MTAAIPGAINIPANELTSDMIVELGTTAPQKSQSTLGAIADFVATGATGNVVNTAISTAGAGSLTGAALVGGVITRTGPTGDYTDTTVTAAALLAALGATTPVNTSWLVYIKNTVPFTATLAGGTDVTLSGQTLIPANSVGTFLLTYSAITPAFTMRGLEVSPMTTSPLTVATALNTVGAATITAAGIVGGLTTRGGTQSATAMVDTTDTAVAIVAALPNANIGQSFFWTFRNNTDGQSTVTAGAGVTVTGGIVPKNTWTKFLVTLTSLTAVSMVLVDQGQTVSLPPSKVVTGTAATFAAGDITGAYFTNYINNASNATITTRTATQMFGDIPNCQIGHSYQLNIRNLNATGATLTDGGSVTLSGTMSIAQNVTRSFSVVFTSATALTITSMGITAAGA